MVQFKSSYLTYLSALALCLLTLAQGYQLDPHGSCDRSSSLSVQFDIQHLTQIAYKDDLVKAIDNSHKMAKEAASSLRQSGLPFVGNENVKSLVEWLFAPGNTKVVKSISPGLATHRISTDVPQRHWIKLPQNSRFRVPRPIYGPR